MNIRISKPTILIGAILLSLFVIGFVAFILASLFSPSQSVNTTPLPKQKNINPPQDISGNTIKNPSQKVTFSYPQVISPEDVRVAVSPSLPVKVVQGASPGELVVFPDPPDFWAPDVLYAITITDKGGQQLDRYQIKVPRIKVQEIAD